MVSCGQALNLAPTTPTNPNTSSTSSASSAPQVGTEDAGGGQRSHSPERLPAPRGIPPPVLRGVARNSIRPSPPPPGLDYGGGTFLRPMPLRPPFFIREIYKNGFLKRLPYNEKKSSALAKLMKTDRFWVVFSIHDDVHPFLELWHEPTEVASKPPQYIFPLVACQHISPSIIPADSEWSFVINFDTVAIRFSCNSRDVMEDWVEVIRNKLGEMGILNPKGNLYSRTPLGPPVTKPVIRDPTSPLPQPPPVSSSSEVVSSPEQESVERRRRGSGLVESSAGQSQTFTTSIYLNQPAPAPAIQPAQPSLIVNRKTSLPVNLQASDLTPEKRETEGSTATSAVAISSGAAQHSVAGSTSSVYLNQSSPTRHVTVIPINNITDEVEETTNTLSVSSLHEETAGGGEEEQTGGGGLSESVEYENHTYGAIFDFDEKIVGGSSSRAGPSQAEKDKSRVTRSGSPRKEGGKEVSPRRGRDRARQDPPPLPSRPVGRRLSERRRELLEGRPANRQKIRRKSRRSSSLGPLLDGNILAGGELGASTLSLESVDSNSNPRQAVLKSDRNLGAIPRRPLQPQLRHDPGDAPPSLGSPPRNTHELPPGVRPPPYHPLANISHPTHPPGAGPAFPPMIPLPGLTCQLTSPHPPGLSLPPVAPEERAQPRSVREQQVVRLRQEISHPAGVRLQLRKKDVQSSLALVDLFGCVWVVGWKQRDYPVLYNAFHIGDQIISVSGVLIRSSGEFSKLVKLKSNDLHTEIIIRRAPFGQVFYLKPDIEGQSLGIILNNSTAEIKEIIPGSVASQTGVSAKVRSLDGQSVVPLVITEINARPLNLFGKDGETWERLSGISRDPSRDISVLLQPADIVAKFKKQLKSLRGYKDFLLG